MADGRDPTAVDHIKDDGVANGVAASSPTAVMDEKGVADSKLQLNGSDGTPPSGDAEKEMTGSLSSNSAQEPVQGQPLRPTVSRASTKPPLDERPKSKIAIIMLALCMAVFLAALDMTIVATALPTIAQDFSISQAEYNWIGSAYLLASAASTPTWGKVSDIFGRKPVLLVANVIFFVASLLCGVAVNIDMLIAGRVLQGVGGGGLLSLVNITIGDLFSMRKRGMYYGLVGMTWALAGAIGPVLGGAMAQYSTWRWCFYINLPCDGIAFVILFWFLDVETPRTPLVPGLKAIDWLGLVTSVGAVVMFLLGLESGGIVYPWSSATVLCLLIFGVFTFAIFLGIEWKVAKYPMMPPRLFNNRTAIAVFTSTFCHGFVFIAGSYFLPLYFQAVLDASPLLSGVYSLPFILSLSFTSACVGFFIRKTGKFREPIWLGMAFMALGFGLFIDLPDHSGWAKIIIYQIIAGLGVGPNFQAPLIALQSHTDPADLATATGTFAFVRQIGSAMSVVVGGVVFQNRMSEHRSDLEGVLDQQPLDAITDGSAGASVQIVRQLGEPAKREVQRAFTQSLSSMWILYTVVGVIGTVFSLLIANKTLSKQHKVRKQGLDVQEQERQERLRKEKEEKERRKSGAMSGGEENV